MSEHDKPAPKRPYMARPGRYRHRPNVQHLGDPDGRPLCGSRPTWVLRPEITDAPESVTCGNCRAVRKRAEARTAPDVGSV